MMRVIIAGSRTILDLHVVGQAVIDSGFTVTEVVSGGARGVDRLGERIAEDYEVPVTVMEADWEREGRSAGYKRNERMAAYADALIAIWDGESRGTKHMIDIANRVGLSVYVKETRDH